MSSDPTKGPRRQFMLGAAAALPAAHLLGLDGLPLAAADGRGWGRDHEHPDHRCDSVEARRRRWRALADYHMGQENEHDLAGVMETFSDSGVMIMNDLSSSDSQSIANGHVLFGMSSEPGALANTQVIPDREYYTDDSILIFGRVVADHVGQVLQFPATGRRVELHYSAFYRFDAQDKLVSERIVMNWAPLAGA